MSKIEFRDGWSRRFAHPIQLPDGRKLLTLRDAVAHLGEAVPKSEHGHPKVLLAATVLTAAAEGRDFVLHAQIAVGQALRRNDPPADFDTSRKYPSFRRHRLKRDG